MVRCAWLLEENVDVDFVDINMGCPIDLICNKQDPTTNAAHWSYPIKQRLLELPDKT